MNGFLVIKPGPLTLLQDAGRFGYARLGLTTGEPMDGQAFIDANGLVGNDDTATSLEITLGGVVLESMLATQIGMTGADASITVNGNSHDRSRAINVQPGDRIHIGVAPHNCRLYLACAGGFQIPLVFGSAATIVRENLGGIAGRALQAGDFLPCQPQHTPTQLNAKKNNATSNDMSAPLRVVPSFQHDQFSTADRKRFFHSTYQITPQSDRMGYRLAGPALSYRNPTMLSEGIAPGSIQIPPDGQPIVLLSDRQTIGGYPKIGTLIQQDRWRLGQMRPNDQLRFQPIIPQAAYTLLLQKPSSMR